MSTSPNTYDPISDLILSKGLRIESVMFHEDRLLIVLNSKQLLIDSLNNYSKLKSASQSDLKNYKLIGNGTGIHWTKLDEDLSLYGFLKDYLTKNIIAQKELVIA